MNTLNSKFVEEFGWELINQDAVNYYFKKVNENTYFNHNISSGISIIFTTDNGTNFNYFVGKIKTGQFFIDLMESIF